MRAIVREDTADAEVRRLRTQLESVQGRRMDARVLPIHPALAELLPGRGLRAGSAYSLPSSSSLLLALLARPSQDGAWCAAVGMPELGAEAAAHAGVDLSRLVLIPDPGPRWLAVTATVAEVLPVVAVRPPGRVTGGEVARLAARLRERGTVLLVQGAWPQVEASLTVSDPVWTGVGEGHGYLAGRAVTVSASSRRFPVPRKGRMLLPAPDGTIAPLHAAPVAVPVPVPATAAGPSPMPADTVEPMRAAG